jgi:hypothetical protein
MFMERKKIMTLNEIKSVIEDMQAHDIDTRSTIYKICPKCNSKHNDTCENCAWQGIMNVCNIGVKVWEDGSFYRCELQIVKREIGNLMNLELFELWNVQYFPTLESAEKAMKEYDEIRNIGSRFGRRLKYDEWEAKQREKFVQSI